MRTEGLQQRVEVDRHVVDGLGVVATVPARLAQRVKDRGDVALERGARRALGRVRAERVGQCGMQLGAREPARAVAVAPLQVLAEREESASAALSHARAQLRWHTGVRVRATAAGRRASRAAGPSKAATYGRQRGLARLRCPRFER